MFTATVEGAGTLAGEWTGIRAAVREGMRRGVARGVEEGATEARTRHRFRNRTGNLERSIEGRVTGSSELEETGEIVATEAYAVYVEASPAVGAFMGLAYTKCEAVMTREIELGIAQAQSLLER